MNRCEPIPKAAPEESARLRREAKEAAARIAASNYSPANSPKKVVFDEGPAQKAGERPEPIDRTPYAGMLLSPETLADLRGLLPSLRWPRTSLTRLAIELAEASRAAHVNPSPATSLARTEAGAKLDAEREYVADVFLSGLTHAATHKPHELADLLAQVLGQPAVRIAIAPLLADILGPTVDWLRGETADQRERIDGLEKVNAELVEIAR